MERNIVKDVTRLSREHKDTIVSQSGIESSLDENQSAVHRKGISRNEKEKGRRTVRGNTSQVTTISC
jgi:hypothetical protein